MLLHGFRSSFAVFWRVSVGYFVDGPTPPPYASESEQKQVLSFLYDTFMTHEVQLGLLGGLGVMFALYRILLGMQRGGSIEIQDLLPFLGRRVCAGYFYARGPLPFHALPPGRIQGRVVTRIAGHADLIPILTIRKTDTK